MIKLWLGACLCLIPFILSVNTNNSWEKSFPAGKNVPEKIFYFIIYKSYGNYPDYYKIKVWKKENSEEIRIRSEIEQDEQKVDTLVIKNKKDLDKPLFYVIMKDRNRVLQLSSEKIKLLKQPHQDRFFYAFNKPQGTYHLTTLQSEKISGYLCSKIKVFDKDEKIESIIWYSPDLGMPLKINSHKKGQKVFMTVSQIRTTRIPDTIFELPHNYPVIKT